MKKTVTTLFAMLAMLILILDSKTAMLGASQGLVLCFFTLIPSLLPFFFLSNLLCSAVSGRRWKLFRPVERLFRIPTGAAAILLTGFLAGYPVGARQVTQAYCQGQLTKQQAQRMLAFSSNAGPAFLFGILGSKFGDIGIIWILWLIHILSALVVSMLLPGENSGYTARSEKNVSVSEALDSALHSIAIVCGWVILFRVIIAFLQRWFLWLLTRQVQVCIIGLMELANGCCMLDSIPNPGLRFTMASAFLSFGGVCVTLQTLSVTKGLGVGMYLRGKTMQCLFSIILSLILQQFLFSACDCIPLSWYTYSILILIILTGLLYFAFSQKKSGNLKLIGV